GLVATTTAGLAAFLGNLDSIGDGLAKFLGHEPLAPIADLTLRDAEPLFADENDAFDVGAVVENRNAGAAKNCSVHVRALNVWIGTKNLPKSFEIHPNVRSVQLSETFDIMIGPFEKGPTRPAFPAELWVECDGVITEKAEITIPKPGFNNLD